MSAIQIVLVRRGTILSIGVNLTLAWRLKPQLHKLAPAYAGYQTLDFPLVRAGELGFYSSEFHSPGLKLTPMDTIMPFTIVPATENCYRRYMIPFLFLSLENIPKVLIARDSRMNAKVLGENLKPIYTHASFFFSDQSDEIRMNRLTEIS